MPATTCASSCETRAYYMPSLPAFAVPARQQLERTVAHAVSVSLRRHPGVRARLEIGRRATQGVSVEVLQSAVTSRAAALHLDC